MRVNTSTEKAKILSEFTKYLSTNEPLDDITERTKRDVDRLNFLDDLERTYELLEHARAFDIEPPNDDNSCWTTYDSKLGQRALTPAGRNTIRKMIDEEKSRRREAKAWWWKTIILPAITLGIGIVGAITGLVAVIQKLK